MQEHSRMTAVAQAQPGGDKPLTAEPIELIAIDLDGTLLRSDDTVGAASAAAIAEALAAGVKVVLNTGRAPRETRAIYHRLGLTTLAITHNGALVTDPVHGEAIFRHVTLPGAVAAGALRIARQVVPGLAAAIEVIDHCVSDPAGPAPHPEANPAARAPGAVSFQALLTQPVTKVRLHGMPAELGGVQLQLLDQLKGQVTFAFSHPALLQVMGPGADKGLGLAYVARYYGVPRQRVLAIGDAPNDLPMLQWAGLSVAVANAWGDVRRAVDFVVAGNDQDGVAEAIRRFALIR
jgi:Cof subfamily protein (haloacid dehalogenase superfamily)